MIKRHIPEQKELQNKRMESFSPPFYISEAIVQERLISEDTNIRQFDNCKNQINKMDSPVSPEES